MAQLNVPTARVSVALNDDDRESDLTSRVCRVLDLVPDAPDFDPVVLVQCDLVISVTTLLSTVSDRDQIQNPSQSQSSGCGGSVEYRSDSVCNCVAIPTTDPPHNLGCTWVLKDS